MDHDGGNLPVGMILALTDCGTGAVKNKTIAAPITADDPVRPIRLDIFIIFSFCRTNKIQNTLLVVYL